MSLQSGVGVSDEADAHIAGIRASSAAIATLSEAPQLLFVFTSVTYDQKRVLEGVRTIAPQAHIVGASTAGEIATGGPVKHHSVVVMAIHSDTLTVHSGHKTGLKADSYNTGVDVAEDIKKNLVGDARLCMVFPDGLSGNGSDVIRGMQQVLGYTFPIVGGSAGDDAMYKQTYQYHNTDIFSDTLVALGLGGQFSFATGLKHGWMPISQPTKVTKAEGAVLYEIDGKPALEFYKKYIGDEAATILSNNILSGVALEYPLGFKYKESGEYLLRAPFVVNKDGSIICGGEVPTGAEVQLMIGGKDEAVRAARSAAQSALDELGTKPRAALIFDCHTRNKLFGADAKLEIDAIQEVIGREVPLAGFYTYAEHAPLHNTSSNTEERSSVVHNETVVIVLLGD